MQVKADDNTDGTKWNRQHDIEGIAEAIELDSQDNKYSQHGEHQRLHQALYRFLVLFLFTTVVNNNFIMQLAQPLFFISGNLAVECRTGNYVIVDICRDMDYPYAFFVPNSCKARVLFQPGNLFQRY